MKWAQVILFKPSGKYYTEEDWKIPEGAEGPWSMKQSPDFRRISGGAVLVVSQEPWGFPHLFPEEPLELEAKTKLQEEIIEAQAIRLMRRDVSIIPHLLGIKGSVDKILGIMDSDMARPGETQQDALSDAETSGGTDPSDGVGTDEGGDTVRPVWEDSTVKCPNCNTPLENREENPEILKDLPSPVYFTCYQCGYHEER